MVLAPGIYYNLNRFPSYTANNGCEFFSAFVGATRVDQYSTSIGDYQPNGSVVSKISW